jgi:hypothetical protein
MRARTSTGTRSAGRDRRRRRPQCRPGVEAELRVAEGEVSPRRGRSPRGPAPSSRRARWSRLEAPAGPGGGAARAPPARRAGPPRCGSSRFLGPARSLAVPRTGTPAQVAPRGRRAARRRRDRASPRRPASRRRRAGPCSIQSAPTRRCFQEEAPYLIARPSSRRGAPAAGCSREPARRSGARRSRAPARGRRGARRGPAGAGRRGASARRSPRDVAVVADSPEAPSRRLGS